MKKALRFLQICMLAPAFPQKGQGKPGLSLPVWAKSLCGKRVLFFKLQNRVLREGLRISPPALGLCGKAGVRRGAASCHSGLDAVAQRTIFDFKFLLRQYRIILMCGLPISLRQA